MRMWRNKVARACCEHRGPGQPQASEVVMVNATADRPARQRNPLPPVAGVCRWLEHFGSDPDFSRVGVVEIKGRRYSLGRHDTFFRLVACEADKQGKIGNYTIPRDLSSC